MGLVKRHYVDQETVITAQNLNDIQDAIITNENEIAALQPDSAMSDSSARPVQNKVINQTLKAADQATAAYHLGFYLDANGDLCQVE